MTEIAEIDYTHNFDHYSVDLIVEIRHDQLTDEGFGVFEVVKAYDKETKVGFPRNLLDEEALYEALQEEVTQFYEPY